MKWKFDSPYLTMFVGFIVAIAALYLFTGGNL